jgi:hypothetical protein
MRNKLGLKPRQHNRHRLWLSKYINRSVVRPQVQPTDFSVAFTKLGESYQLYANGPDPLAPAAIAATGIGDCFMAGNAEFLRIAAANGGKVVNFPCANVVAAYSAATGYVLGDDSTDQGTDPDQGMVFMQNTGIQDDAGTYHKIGAFVAVNPKDFGEVCLASELFGGLGVGVEFLENWENDQVWDVNGGQVAGGHWIYNFSTLPSAKTNQLPIVSWGGVYYLTEAALAADCDCLYAVVDSEFFGPNGKAINGFDADQLAADLKNLPSWA